MTSATYNNHTTADPDFGLTSVLLVLFIYKHFSSPYTTSIMPAVNCPIDGCSYATPDLDAVIIAALLNTHATTHTAAPASRDNTTAKVEKVKRPTVTSAGSSEDWTYFLSRWRDYKAATKVTGGDLIIQLLECCDEEHRKDLTRSAVGSLTEQTEDQVLKAIKVLAVREESVMVARVTLNNMQQDRDEPIRAFGARLRGQANICKYVMKCPSCEEDVNYTDPILRDALCHGIIDQEIQLDLLSNTNQDMTLEEVFHFVEAKELGKRSASRLLDSQGAEAVRSSYRKQKSADNQCKLKVCSYCGKSGHGEKSIAKVRSTTCPSYGHTCKHCKKLHHFDDMCRSRSRAADVNKRTTDNWEGAIFNQLCTISVNNQKEKSLHLDHQIYNQFSDSWKRKPSKPQPYINFTTKILSQ